MLVSVLSRGPVVQLCVAASLVLAALPAHANSQDPDRARQQATQAGLAEESLSDDALPLEVQAALTAAQLPPTALSALVLEPGGKVRMAYRAGAVRQVGSVMKLVTTLFALEQLGPAFHFQTELLANPAPGPRAGWELALRGGGDPGFRYEDLLHMLREAQQRGVTDIVGPVRLDASRFADELPAASGIRLDPGRVSGTLPWALTIDFSAIDVNLPAGGPGPLLADPPITVRYAESAARSGARCAADWPDALTLDVLPSDALPAGVDRHFPGRQPVAMPPDSARLLLQGTWASDCPAAHLLRSPLTPQGQFEAELNAAWRALGHPGRLHTELALAPSYASVQVLRASRPLAELIRDANKFSNNLMARTLLLDAAAEAGDLPAHVADGERRVRAWLAVHGLYFPELHIENGAGLSHSEVLTPAHLGMLLRLGLESPASPEFMASLPIPGQDGTLKTRYAELPGGARLRLKSGSLDGVRALAGYWLEGSQGASVVVFILNDPAADRGTPVFEALLHSLAR